MTDVIDGLTFYLIEVKAAEHFSYGDLPTRQHIFLRMQAAEAVGWSELNVGMEAGVFNLKDYVAEVATLKGKPLGEAFRVLCANQGIWPDRQSEAAEMALIDTAGKVRGLSALDLLDLGKRKPVPGLFCILERDPERVREQAALAIERGLTRFVKVKLFGEIETDLRIVETVREVLGPNTFLIGDANYGYRPDVQDEPVQPMIGLLRRLHERGLCAFEDPANLTHSQWSDLQHHVKPLALLMDEAIRPAREARKKIRAEMAEIFNTHPGCMGSIVETIALARAVRSIGRRHMVGDSSLVGPAGGQARQCGGQSIITNVDFGGLHQALRRVPVPGRKAANEKQPFQNR